MANLALLIVGADAIMTALALNNSISAGTLIIIATTILSFNLGITIQLYRDMTDVKIKLEHQRTLLANYLVRK
jgi:hypothetical protein